MGPRAKPGEGIVAVIDVGPAVRASSDTTFYNQAKQCLISILQRKIFADKCRDMVGIVLFGTDGTQNNLANGNQYQHITVLQDLQLVTWNLISSVERLERGNSKGDWLDALVVALDLLREKSDHYNNKKIVLMTDFNTEFTDDQAQSIIGGLKKMEIDLSVIGPNLDEEEVDNEQGGPSNGSPMKNIPKLNWNGKPKCNIQLAGEALIRRIVSEVNGIICCFDEAIPQLIFFEKKSQGSAAWNSNLEIGSNFKIPITGKIKVKHATAASWKKAHVKDEAAAIITETSYHKLDANHTTVEREDIIAGFRYGTTLVPFSEEDMQLQYSCDAPGAQLCVLGFTRSSLVPLNLRAGDQVMIITARDYDEDAAVALSAVIQGLKELDMVAIARKVYRKNLNPTLGALYPDITSDYECLVWVGLPFQEDVRNFTFPPLEKTTSKITKEQNDAMDELISSMDLSSKDDDDEDEQLDPTLIVNPQLQHFFNCLTNRALSPDDPLPAPSQHILNILKPSKEVLDNSEAAADKLKKLFPVKREVIVKKKKLDLLDGDDGEASTSRVVDDAPLSASDLIGNVVTKITTATPVADFRSLLMAECPNYNLICQQMENVILQMVDSLSGSSSGDLDMLPKIIDAMKAFREEALNIDPNPYNNFMTQLKLAAVARLLNTLWDMIRQDNLGKIDQSETLKSRVSKEESEEFLRLVTASAAAEEEEVVDDDMLDDL